MGKVIEGEIFHEVEDMGHKKYRHIGFRDKEQKFADMLESLVPEIGMKKKGKVNY